MGSDKCAGQNRSEREPFGRDARLSSGFLERERAGPSARRKACEPGKQRRDFQRLRRGALGRIVQRLDRVMKDLEAAVEKMPEDKLALKAPLISHISTHNAYHTGQILYVRKLQGSWNPENGVK